MTSFYYIKNEDRVIERNERVEKYDKFKGILGWGSGMAFLDLVWIKDLPMLYYSILDDELI